MPSSRSDSVLFEVPTGVVADTRGRRFSYLVGTATLLASTLLYLGMWQAHAPLWGWAIASILLGLGFTFFSGATEAWLVDALKATGFTGTLEEIFGRAQVVGGMAMLVGTVSGGVVAQADQPRSAVPVRAAMLRLTLVVAFRFMRDLGFTPERDLGPVKAVRNVISGAVDGGFRNRPVRWLMLAAPFSFGTGIYVFYAPSPTCSSSTATRPPMASPDWRPRSSPVPRSSAVSSCRGSGACSTAGRPRSWWPPSSTSSCWSCSGLTGELRRRAGHARRLGLRLRRRGPVRQAFVNGLIPSEQRATVLSFDNLMGSAGGVVAQPALGRVADVNGYAASYLVSAGILAFALPFTYLARRENASSDPILDDAAAVPDPGAAG